jgi:hypothetical protein
MTALAEGGKGSMAVTRCAVLSAAVTPQVGGSATKTGVVWIERGSGGSIILGVGFGTAEALARAAGALLLSAYLWNW